MVSGIWLHTCSCLTLCVLGLGLGAGLRRRAELRGPDQAEGCAAARMAGLPGP